MPAYNKNNPETIQAMFGSIAENYDKTNAVLSFCLHKHWNNQLVRLVIGERNPGSLLDLCCGTGEIAFSHLKKTSIPCSAYLLDFCPEMLTHARLKSKALALQVQGHKISYIQADAQEIPLGDDSIDCATMAYGVRNVQDPAKCLRDVHRVLKTGGTFGILELTQPSNPFLRAGHKVYLKTILPILGKVLTSNQAAYQYLCNSIHAFIKPVELAALLRQAGFHDVKVTSISGGVATIISGVKS